MCWARFSHTMLSFHSLFLPLLWRERERDKDNMDQGSGSQTWVSIGITWELAENRSQSPTPEDHTLKNSELGLTKAGPQACPPPRHAPTRLSGICWASCLTPLGPFSVHINSQKFGPDKFPFLTYIFLTQTIQWHLQERFMDLSLQDRPPLTTSFREINM